MAITENESTERWLPIEGFESTYHVSNRGRVKSFQNGERMLSPWPVAKGYLMVELRDNGKRSGRTVHRLVAEAFLERPSESHEVNHLDGDKTNNHLSNLEWVTTQENRDHAVATGLHTCGEETCTAKLTADEVREIRHRYSEGTYQRVLAEEFGVSRSHVSDIVNHKKWRHLD